MCLKNVRIRCVPIAIAGGADINVVIVVDDVDVVAIARFGLVILCSNRNMNDKAAGIVVFLCNDDEVLLGNRVEDLFMSLLFLHIMCDSLFDIRLRTPIG